MNPEKLKLLLGELLFQNLILQYKIEQLEAKVEGLESASPSE